MRSSSHHPARHPKGTPAGGRFATQERTETGTTLCAPRGGTVAGPGDPALSDWDAPAETETPAGAFSRCKEVSAEYTEHLRARGIDAEWVQVVGPTGEFPDAQEPWQGLSQAAWQHYLTRVRTPAGDLYIDWTARQFDPDAPHPHVTSVADDAWTDTYPLDEQVLTQFLRLWRHEAASKTGETPRA